MYFAKGLRRSRIVFKMLLSRSVASGKHFGTVTNGKSRTVSSKQASRLGNPGLRELRCPYTASVDDYPFAFGGVSEELLGWAGAKLLEPKSGGFRVIYND